jgi:hypothetical protein
MKHSGGFRKVSIASLIQDAFDLRIHLTKDLDVLTRAGLDPNSITELIQKTKETERIDLEYQLYKQEYRRATISLSKFKTECKKKRASLHKLLNRSYSNTGLNYTITSLKHKRASVDISQDLLELAIHAESMNKRYPGSIIDSSLITNARQMSGDLLKMATQHALDHPHQIPLSSKRKEAIYSLKVLMKEIRHFARDVLQSEPVRVKAYRV